jgi:DNA-binding NarL/FixJ family response regulator
MGESNNAEVRAALRDSKRVSVAIASGAGAQGLKLLIDTISTNSINKTCSPKPERADLPTQQPKHRATRLTHRELQVLTLIAKGLHNRQIAARIHRSIKTVEKHRQSLHSKLSTHEVAGLTRQALAMGLMDKTQRVARRLAKGARQLTKRELEILRLVALGSGNKWIASELRRSIKTVDHHRENIMKKLGIHEVAGLTRHALAIGLL